MTEQAFPIPYQEPGLTKREYISISAMQGMLANKYVMGSDNDIAKWSVQQADSLIKELGI